MEEEEQGGREEVEIRAKMEQLLQVTFHESARGQFVSFHFCALSSLPLLMQLLWIHIAQKVSLAATPKICPTSKSLSVLCVLTLPSHYVSPFTRTN